MDRVRRRRSVVATPRVKHARSITGTPATGLRVPRTPAHTSMAAADISAQASRLDAALDYDGTDVVGVSWRLHKATPLHGLNTDDRSLKRMARSITATIEAQTAQGTGVAMDLPESDVGGGPLQVDVTTLPLLRGCDDDATALSIAITRQQAGGKSSLAGRMVLCSVGIGQLAKVERVRAPFAHLPLVLVKASAALARTILHWLEETFDCAVTPMALTPQDMAWIATEWAAPAATDKALAQRPLTLQYGVPGDGSLQTISYSVDPASIRALQERLAGGDDDTALLRALEKHFAAEFSVDLTKMTLARVGTYAVYIGADGRAKFLPLPDTCATATLHALKYFTYVATRPPTT